MTTESEDLAYDLHVLVARLDASADRILQATHAVTYRRFLTVLALRDLGATTQRALAERLGVSEPSVSRMTAVLASDGLVLVESDPAGGNRRRLTLTRRGLSLTSACVKTLEGRLVALVEGSGVPYASYARHTRQLLQALAADGAVRPTDDVEGGAA